MFQFNSTQNEMHYEASKEKPAWQKQSFKLDFVIVGTQKGGTTALNDFLSKHPQVCTGIVKEAHFFDTESCFVRSQPDYRRYHFNFRHYTNQIVAGEATPSYMYNPKVAKRLFRYNPNLKLVFLLRHPVERAFSHYEMMRRLGHEYLPFETALRMEKLRLKYAGDIYMLDSPAMLYSYTSRGFYSKQIEKFLQYFPINQMLFLRSEDLRQNHSIVMKRVLNFLGVDPAFIPQRELLHRGYGSSVSKTGRTYLLGEFEQEVVKLEQLLSWDLRDWRK